MTLKESKILENEAKRLGVSKIARSERGFMRAYEATRGNPILMSTLLVPGIGRTQTWSKRRNEFISRHIKQYEKNPTYRRWLALAMWAYKAPI